MKITDIKQEYFRWPKSRIITNGTQTYAYCGLGIIVIDTDEGIRGYGMSGPILGRNAFDLAIEWKEKIIGQDPLDINRIWDRLYNPKLIGRKGLAIRAISGIDMALWDIKGKTLNISLSKLLGQYRESVPTYIAGGYYEKNKTIKDLQLEMESYIEQGVAGVKMKVGGLSPREDALRVKAVRETIGPDKILMVDANCSYRYPQALEFARRTEEYNLYCFEEPVQPYDYDGMKQVAKQCTTPIAAGENEYTKWGFRELIETKAVPILNPAPFLMGGVTEFLNVAALSQAHCLELAPHGDQTINVSLGASIANVSYVEYYPEEYDHVLIHAFQEPLEIDQKGKLVPPDRPGIGFTPNYHTLEPYRII